MVVEGASGAAFGRLQPPRVPKRGLMAYSPKVHGCGCDPRHLACIWIKRQVRILPSVVSVEASATEDFKNFHVVVHLNKGSLPEQYEAVRERLDQIAAEIKNFEDWELENSEFTLDVKE
jgi:hypothetical protein